MKLHTRLAPAGAAAATLALVAGLAGPAAAATPDEVATGLVSPLSLAVAQDGTVYVTRTDPTSLPEDLEIDELEIEPVATVEVDAFGNFYSTEPLPLPEEALFVIVERSDGAGRNFMGWPTLTAACNACHVGSNVLAVRD